MSMDENIPPEVRALPYRERILWHRNRVELETVVYSFLSVLRHEMNIDDLKAELEYVRRKRKKIELRLRMLEHPEFSKCQMELSYHVAMAQGSVGKFRITHLHQAKKYQDRLCTICK